MPFKFLYELVTPNSLIIFKGSLTFGGMRSSSNYMMDSLKLLIPTVCLYNSKITHIQVNLLLPFVENHDQTRIYFCLEFQRYLILSPNSLVRIQGVYYLISQILYAQVFFIFHSHLSSHFPTHIYYDFKLSYILSKIDQPPSLMFVFQAHELLRMGRLMSSPRPSIGL